MNLSILDGWWAEAYDGRNGFAIGKGTSHTSEEALDKRDAADLYRVWKRSGSVVLRTRLGRLATAWIQMMIHSISSLAWRFSSHRMVADYARLAYVPAAGGLSSDMSLR